MSRSLNCFIPSRNCQNISPPSKRRLRGHRASLEESEKSIAAEEARRRRLDSDLKDVQQKVQKYRGQTSSVKTNDEFRALQHEIDFAEAEICEDGRSAASDHGNDSRHCKPPTPLRKPLLRSSMRWWNRRRRSPAPPRRNNRQNSPGLSRSERNIARRSTSSVLSTYDRVSASSRKTGLARVQGQRCLACQMYLRPQIWNQIRGGQLLACESCARLLYFDPVLGAATASTRRPREKEAHTQSDRLQRKLARKLPPPLRNSLTLAIRLFVRSMK